MNLSAGKQPAERVRSIIKRAIAIAATSFFLAAGSALAADEPYRWDTATGDSVVTEGGGTWTTGAGNWASNALYDQVWLNNAGAHFGGGTAGTAGTVTLGANMNAWRLYFDTPNAGNYTIDLAGNDLKVGAASGPVYIYADGTITNSSGTGSLIINAASPNNTLIFGGGNLTVAAEISKCNFLKVSSGGWLTLSGNNTFTGRVELANQSQFRISGSGTLGWNGSEGDYSESITMKQGTDFRYVSTATQTLSGVISDDFPEAQDNDIFMQGPGILILSGANTYAGRTFINGGTLIADIADGAGSGALGIGDIDFGGGTLQFTANSAGSDYSARIKNSAGAIIIDTAGQDVTWTNILNSSNTGGLTKEGAGKLIVWDDGDCTGVTRVNGGTLVLTNRVGDTGHWEGTAWEINNGSTLEINEGDGVNILFDSKTFTFDATGGGNINLTGSSVLWRDNTIKTTGGPSNTVTGDRMNFQNSYSVIYDIADGTDPVDLNVSLRHDRGSIVKNGAGVVALTDNVNNMNTADDSITVNAGTLDVAGGGRLNSGSYDNDITINTGGIFKYSSSSAQTLSGIIGGAGLLVKDNTGSTLTITGTNNTHSGPTTIDAGTLLISGAGRLGSGSYAGAITNEGVFLYDSSADQTLSGIISGAGTVTKTNASTLTLSGSSDSTGGTFVNGGVLLVNNSGGSGTGTGTVTINSGGKLGGTGSISGLVSVSSGGHVDADVAAGTLTLNGGLTLVDGSELDFAVNGSGLTGSILITNAVPTTFTGAASAGGVTVNLDVTGIVPGVYTLVDWTDQNESGVDAADFDLVSSSTSGGTLSISGKKLLLTLVAPGSVFSCW